MLRLTPLALSASLVPIFGCTDVPVAMSEGSSSGSSDDTVVSPGTSTSLGGSASGPVDSTTSSSEGGVASTTTESSTTSDPVSTGHARMLVVEGLPYDVSPSVFEYAEGVASDLIPLTGELPRDVTFSDFSVSDAGTDLGRIAGIPDVGVPLATALPAGRLDGAVLID